MDVDEALANSDAPWATAEVRTLADEVRQWRRVGMAILRTHRSGDVVLLQEDAAAIAHLLGEA